MLTYGFEFTTMLNIIALSSWLVVCFKVTTFGDEPTTTQLAALGYFAQRRQLILYGELNADGDILDETIHQALTRVV